MTPSSQTMEPPGIPERFKRPRDRPSWLEPEVSRLLLPATYRTTTARVVRLLPPCLRRTR
jgi:hypothetical protein